MKKVVLTCLTLCFCALMVTAQSVDFTQHTLVSKRTASWCSNCGSWGWDAFEGILADFEDTNMAIGVAVHSSSSDYSNAVTQHFMQHIGTGSQPVFYHGKANLGLGRSNTAAKRQELMDIVADAAAVPSSVGLGATSTVAGDDLTVSVAYSVDAGSYRLGVYLLNNNLVGFQSTRGNTAQHKRMLVDFITPSVEGELLNDTEGTVSYTASISDLNITDVEDYEILVVAWELTDGLAFANGRVTDIDQGAVSTVKTEIEGLKILTNDVAINVSWSTADVSRVDLIDQSGKLVATKNVDGQQVQLDTPSRSGLYILSLYTPSGLFSEQITILK